MFCKKISEWQYFSWIVFYNVSHISLYLSFSCNRHLKLPMISMHTRKKLFNIAYTKERRYNGLLHFVNDIYVDHYVLTLKYQMIYDWLSRSSFYLIYHYSNIVQHRMMLIHEVCDWVRHICSQYFHIYLSKKYLWILYAYAPQPDNIRIICKTSVYFSKKSWLNHLRLSWGKDCHKDINVIRGRHKCGEYMNNFQGMEFFHV